MNQERKTSKIEIEHYDLEILLRRPSLRTNIPRRNSQACREIISTKETTCGIGCIRGEWFQSFANRKAFTFTYGILGSFYGSYYAYFYGTITSLERRFKISSQTVGAIANLSDIVQIIMCLILFKYVPKNHQPKWIGFGIYIVILSTISSALPHFFYGLGSEHPPERYTNITYLSNDTFEIKGKICPTELQPSSTNREGYMPIILLVIAQILNGIGGSFYFMIGASYIDENITKHQAPALLSFLFILKTLGPALGYCLSSMCLKIFSSPLMIPFMNESDTHWIGAWWLGNPIVGFILFIPATIIILFPTRLPKTAIKNALHGTKDKNDTEQNPIIIKDTLTTFKGTLLNSTFYCNNFAGIFNILGHTVYFIFLPKYASIQYRISDSDANFIAGTITLLVSTLGIIIASSVITRYTPKPKFLAAWNIFVGIITTVCLVSYIYLGCPENDAQSKAMASQVTNYSFSNECKYRNFEFSPVCSEKGDTFISPCEAECNRLLYINNTKIYTDCNNIFLKSSKTKTVVQEHCSVDCHFHFIIFMIITCTLSLINATGRTSNFLFQIKFIKGQTKSNLLKFALSCLALFSFAPYQILFGYILDIFCLVWDNNCEQSGNCWLYDNEKLRFTMNLVAIGFVVFGIIFDAGVWFLVKDVKVFDNDENTDESNED